MRVDALLLASVCLILISGGVGAATAVGQPGTADEVDQNEPQLFYDVHVDAEGDAHWTITAEFPIGNDTEAEAFDQLATAYEDDGGEEYLPLDAFEVAVRELRDVLDRAMFIENEERSVERMDETGALKVSFVWTEFASVEDDRIHVGDVFDAGEQRWFTRLEANEHLRIHSPDEYAVESSGLPVVNGTMTISGPADLEAADVSGTFVFAGDGSNGDDGSLLPALTGGLFGLLGLLLLAVIAASVSGWSPLRGGRTRQEGESDQPSPPDAESEEPDKTVGPEPVPDPELLSDEERVLTLIEQNGGRMKQADIVTETDWSNAKVSQLLSQMADDGDIEKLRIGRENLIRLPDANDDAGR